MQLLASFLTTETVGQRSEVKKTLIKIILYFTDLCKPGPEGLCKKLHVTAPNLMNVSGKSLCKGCARPARNGCEPRKSACARVV